MISGFSKHVVLIVNNNYDGIRQIYEILKNTYIVNVATDFERAQEAALRVLPDVVLIDTTTSIAVSLEVCCCFKQNKMLKDIPMLFLSDKPDEKNAKKVFSLGAEDYIAKPFNTSTLCSRIEAHLTIKKSNDILKNQIRLMDEEIQRLNRNISIVQEVSISTMASLAETRDNETGGHLRRARLYIRELAAHMGKTEKFKTALPPERIKLIALSSPLHDIGKIGIPDHILLKPGPLTAEEYQTMKKHPIIGRDVILRAEKLIATSETFLSCAREIAYSHHEKWDGTGYPEGLSGTDIPLPARLMAVVDAYDALTSRRIYKDAVSHEKAVSIIKTDSGKHFDPDVVNSFLAIKERFRQISTKHRDNIIDIRIDA